MSENTAPRNPKLGYFNCVRYNSPTYEERMAYKCQQLYEMLEYLLEKTGTERYCSSESNMNLAKRRNGECYYVTFFRGTQRRVFCFRNVPTGVQFRWEVDLRTGEPIRNESDSEEQDSSEDSEEGEIKPQTEDAIKRIAEDWWLDHKERLMAEIEFTSAEKAITLDKSWRVPAQECESYLDLFIRNSTKGRMILDSIDPDGTALIVPASFEEADSDVTEQPEAEPYPTPTDKDVPEEKEVAMSNF